MEFKGHNIQLDDGRWTVSEDFPRIVEGQRYLSARRILDAVCPGDRSATTLVDIGCFEGGYATEFARLGFDATGLEVRESNIACCEYVKAHTDLPNLRFVRDDANNIADHGVFDITFCSGLLYHLDKPRAFLENVARSTRKLLILQTHFSTTEGSPRDSAWTYLRYAAGKLTGHKPYRYNLSRMTTNEGLEGRWYTEFRDQATYADRDARKWSSWDNWKSFWVRREHLLFAIKDAGFDVVMEQFDDLEPTIRDSMIGGYYDYNLRGTFIALKTRPE